MTKKAQTESKAKLHDKTAKNAEATDEKKVDTNSNTENEEIEDATDNDESEKNDKKSDKKKNSSKNKTDEKEEKIKELEAQIQALSDKHLRLQAEFDNFRKRTLKERMDLIKNAGEDTLKDLLPVIDDIDRAIANIDAAKDLQAVKDGINLIQLKFQDFMKSKGLAEIEALHVEFDTDLHEAITKIPAPEEELKGKIVDVIQKGYTLNEKVVRFAKVIIGE